MGSPYKMKYTNGKKADTDTFPFKAETKKLEPKEEKNTKKVLPSTFIKNKKDERKKRYVAPPYKMMKDTMAPNPEMQEMMKKKVNDVVQKNVNDSLQSETNI